MSDVQIKTEVEFVLILPTRQRQVKTENNEKYQCSLKSL
jgi:hypothetical protein